MKSISRLALVFLDGSNRRFTLERTRIQIGKARESDVWLDHETVSRRHCEIRHERSGYLLRDLGSTNGTRLNGERVREAYLKPGCVLRIGTLEFQVQLQAPSERPAPSERESFGDCVAVSEGMRSVFGVLERAAQSETNVLLTGETGTGKELLARAIHQESPRANGPFVIVDCGAMVGSLFESELFGHVRGAFTGASNDYIGAFERANGGTLFLDELGELPLALQPKLLRVVQDRRLRRVGDSIDRELDIRIISATNRDLSLEVQRGKFREDLFFRLAVLAIGIPPLRERLEDIPVLTKHLLRQIEEDGQPTPQLDRQAIAALGQHHWPGNVRELKNALVRAGLLAQMKSGGTLSFPSAPPRKTEGAFDFAPGVRYRDAKSYFEEKFERSFVAWILDLHDGNISAAARAADMDRKYLHKLAKKHGLHPSDR